MTATLLTTTTVHRGARPSRPTPTIYRRRRTIAGIVVSIVLSSVGVAAQGVLTGPGGEPASAAGAGTASTVRHVRAEAGDSLWSIGERFHGDVGLSRYVDALVDLNGGSAIVVGQVVHLP
ncbi:MAG: LysM peptidoglycan-binding domain-containing protein [Ilumatobacteraceae bacterium]